MANARGEHIDTTYLTVEHTLSRDYGHRDYLSSWLKYSAVVKFIRTQKYWRGKGREPWILDVACGKLAPLAKPLAMKQNVRAEDVGYYLGVDFGPISTPWLAPGSTFPAEFIERTDFSTVDWGREYYGRFQIINYMEAAEHCEPDCCFKILQNIYRYMSDDARAFISTPIYNGKAALNHVNEMSYFGFETLMELAGLEVEKVRGSFCSRTDYINHMNDHCAWVYNSLVDHLEPEGLSVIMGMLIEPHLARNALWRMTKATPITLDKATWKYLAQPEHGSSEEWTPFIKSLQKSF